MEFAPVRSVEITLDRPRRWAFDMNAFLALHEELGANAIQRIRALVSEESQAKPEDARERMTVLTVFLWAGFASEEQPPSLKLLRSLVHPGNIAPLLEQAMSVYGPAMPEVPQGHSGLREGGAPSAAEGADSPLVPPATPPEK